MTLSFYIIINRRKVLRVALRGRKGNLLEFDSTPIMGYQPGLRRAGCAIYDRCLSTTLIFPWYTDSATGVQGYFEPFQQKVQR